MLTGAAHQGPDFAGMEKDPMTGEHYDHARSHLAVIGRFMGPDQLGGTAGYAQSWNRYVYTRNNPLKYVDPNGRETITFTITTFIPSQTVRSPLGIFGTYRGDGRSFDSSPDALHRTRQTFSIETDSQKAEQPLIPGAVATTSGSAKLDSNGNVIKEGGTDLGSLDVIGKRGGDGSFSVTATSGAKDPLSPSFLTPDAGYKLTISGVNGGGSFVLSGSIDAYPSSEIYATGKNGKTYTVFQNDPSGVSPWKLLDIFRLRVDVACPGSTAPCK